MTLKQPKSMDECIYFTNRTIDNGKIKAWVPKELCHKCKKGLMAKPKDPKTGKPKIRADYYECPDCKHTAEKKEYEETLTCNVEYTCPRCNNKDEIQLPYKRKKIQRLNPETGKKQSIDSLRFQCSKCKENIDITKKMK